MSRLTRPIIEETLRKLELPTTDEPVDWTLDITGFVQKEDEDEDDEEEEDVPLLGIDDSLVLLLSLRQTRLHHLSSLFPIFPAPKPRTKNKQVQPPDLNEWFPPFLIKPLSTVGMKVGPLSFEGVTLWVCRFDEKTLREAGHTAFRPPPMPFRPPPMAPQPPPGPIARPAASNQPSTSSAGRPPTPQIIALVNQEAAIHPWLSLLLQRAARSQASQDELSKLSQVVDALGKGQRLIVPPPNPDGKLHMRLPGKLFFVQRMETPVGGKPQQVVPQGMTSRPVAMPGNHSGSSSVSPNVAGGISPIPRIASPGMPPPPPMTNSNIPGSIPTPSGPRPPMHHPHMPPPHPMHPPIIRIPYIPPLIVISFRENIGEKFVLPLELAYLSYRSHSPASEILNANSTPGIPGTPVSPSKETKGNLKISTFLPSKGWGKWAFPPHIRPGPPHLPPKYIRPPGQHTGSISATAAPGVDPTTRKRKRSTDPVDLPVPDKPFGPIGGVTIPEGEVRPMNIVMTDVPESAWNVIEQIQKEIEGYNDHLKRIQQQEEAAEEEPKMAETAKATRGTQARSKPAEEEKQTSLKSQIFNTLLQRVPPRKYLELRVPAPVPREFNIALTEPFTAIYRNVTHKLRDSNNDKYAQDEPEGQSKSKKKRIPSPDITYELPMNFDGVEEAIAKAAAVSTSRTTGKVVATPLPSVPAGASRRRGPRGNTDKLCDGCRIPGLKVWRKGPNGPATLCQACANKYEDGKLELATAPPKVVTPT